MSYDYDDVRPARGRRYDDDEDDEYDYDYDYDYDRKPKVRRRGGRGDGFTDLYPKQMISYGVLALMVILTVVNAIRQSDIHFIFVLIITLVMVIMGFFLSTLPAFVTAAVVALVLLVSLIIGAALPVLFCSPVLLGMSLILRDTRL